ncbi:MAG: ribosome silencing factor [Alphaproteobacteria bacterium]
MAAAGSELSAVDAHNVVLGSLEDAKSENIISIDITGKSPFGDYMIIASGRSHRHVGAIADQLVTALKQAGGRGIRVEGQRNCDWVLVDNGDVIVHIFRPEVREFYGIEKMWQSGQPVAPAA